MKSKIAAILTLLGCLVTAAWADDAKAPYPAMAPLDQYLMADRNAEIALARSSAPPSISDNATVLVLGRQGYETAATGTNGFTCLVERSWMCPFDQSDFWNPKLRATVCYNAAASKTVLQYTLFRTKLVLAGVSKTELHDRLVAAVSDGTLVPPAIGAMSYMMSKDMYLGDGAGHWHPHLMFHIPKTDAASWGADLPGSPVLFDTDHKDYPEPESVFFVPVSKWSDGTPAHH